MCGLSNHQAAADYVYCYDYHYYYCYYCYHYDYYVLSYLQVLFSSKSIAYLLLALLLYYY